MSLHPTYTYRRLSGHTDTLKVPRTYRIEMLADGRVHEFWATGFGEVLMWLESIYGDARPDFDWAVFSPLDRTDFYRRVHAGETIYERPMLR